MPLRGCGQLTELRAADLRFTPEEAATGRSSQAIPGQLVVTLDTVKKHVSHVLGKLGAADRTEAVIRARELSPVP